MTQRDRFSNWFLELSFIVITVGNTQEVRLLMKHFWEILSFLTFGVGHFEILETEDYSVLAGTSEDWRH
jgi:hypothetical protein